MELTLIAVIVTALFFDFTNGFHDTANSIATSVSTHALSPRMAVLSSEIQSSEPHPGAGRTRYRNERADVALALMATPRRVDALLSAMVTGDARHTETTIAGLPE